MSLPHPWIAPPGATMRLIGGRLTLTLPSSLVPCRRYADVRIDQQGVVEVIHGGPFTRPRPGMNAWQGDWHQTEDGSVRNLTRLDRDLARCWGSTGGLRNSLIGRGEVACAVRPTPEGFTIVPLTFARQRHGAPLQTEVTRELRETLVRHPKHGGQGASSTWIDEIDQMPTYYLAAALRGIRPAVPSKKRETDMAIRKIDTTTSDDLPFGITAGEQIVQCEFTDGGRKSYAYFVGGLDVAVGDYVTVASPNGTGVYDEESGGFLTVVRVTSVDLNPEGVRKAAKWIISKVDLTSYRERRAKVEALRTIDARIKLAERDARARLEMEKLRDLSPELSALIAEREALTKPAS